MFEKSVVTCLLQAAFLEGCDDAGTVCLRAESPAPFGASESTTGSGTALDKS